MLAPLLRAPAKNASPSRDRELRAYHWNLRLLGSTSLGDPEATSAAGTPVSPDDVIATLHAGADLWLTDRNGSIDGAFPQGAPPFVLLDDDAPLLRVLRAKVPAARFKSLCHRDKLLFIAFRRRGADRIIWCHFISHKSPDVRDDLSSLSMLATHVLRT